VLGSPLVRRSPAHIAADRSRVVTRLFVPGHEGFDQQESRSNSVLQRVLDLSDEEVQRSLDDVVARFNGRHHDLTEIFLEHADELSDRLNPERQLSPARRLLLGATFTSEYAVEGAALCNPSMVLHPDQAGVTPGTIRFVMSVRAIGEGHNSSIGFRTGTISASAEVEFDSAPTFATKGRRDEALLGADAFKGELRRLRGSVDDSDYVLGPLGAQFTSAQLEVRLGLLEDHVATRKQARRTIGQIRRVAERSYGIRFQSDVWPSFLAESAADLSPCHDLIGNPTPSPIHRTHIAGQRDWRARRRGHRGRWFSSGTVGLRSRLKWAGWCSLTGSVPCVRTTSGHFCSTSRIPLESSAGCASRSSALPVMSKTVTCRMSCTHAALSFMAAAWSFLMELATPRSGWQRRLSMNFSMPYATAPIDPSP
jgi:hypothetical protein